MKTRNHCIDRKVCSKVRNQMRRVRKLKAKDWTFIFFIFSLYFCQFEFCPKGFTSERIRVSFFFFYLVTWWITSDILPCIKLSTNNVAVIYIGSLNFLSVEFLVGTLFGIEKRKIKFDSRKMLFLSLTCHGKWRVTYE